MFVAAAESAVADSHGTVRSIERGPGDEGGRDPGFGRLGVGGRDGRGPAAVDPRGGLCFAAETGSEARICGVPGADHLQGGQGTALGTGEMDDAHATRADPREHAVPADRLRVLGGIGQGRALVRPRTSARRNEAAHCPPARPTVRAVS
ncbi:hypothetical protein GCM10010300_79340 [Streptomyces olivaceoviridis]|nr:hypothetical protein GCM10010300_79340 [Streptomyces olivaceoviridis]